MPENKLKYGEKVFLIVAMIAIIGTCGILLLMCGG
jgi:hypothetical protein